MDTAAGAIIINHISTNTQHTFQQSTKTRSLLIVIPARFASSRFPGKPLAMLHGQSMLQRVYNKATQACIELPNTEIVIATEDQRIIEHANEIGAKALLTSSKCASGTDRAFAACTVLNKSREAPFDCVINLQGDAPLTPSHIITEMAKRLLGNSTIPVLTPITQLSWEALDSFIEHKQQLPFSGTTVIKDANEQALWFSKAVIPLIRDQTKLRNESTLSPIFRHIGLYGYQYKILKRFVELPIASTEQLEGLEQLRFLENGISVKTFTVQLGGLSVFSGVDTLADLQRIERWLIKNPQQQQMALPD